jgi:hypothetical protein
VSAAGWSRELVHTGFEAAELPELFVPVGLDRRLVHTAPAASTRAGSIVDVRDFAAEGGRISSGQSSLPYAATRTTRFDKDRLAGQNFMWDVWTATTLASDEFDAREGRLEGGRLTVWCSMATKIKMYAYRMKQLEFAADGGDLPQP